MELAKESEEQKLLKLMEINKLYRFESKFINMGIKKEYVGKRGSYNGKSYDKPYILLNEVYCRGIVVADELYMRYSKPLRKLGKLNVGDVISFNGKVTSFFRNYEIGVKEDYGIGWPNRCFLLNNDNSHERTELSSDDDDFMDYIVNQDNSFLLDRRYNKSK